MPYYFYNSLILRLRSKFLAFWTFSIDVNVDFAMPILHHTSCSHLLYDVNFDLVGAFSVFCDVAGGYFCRLEEHHGEGLFTLQIQSFNYAFLYHGVHQLLQVCFCNDYRVVCLSHVVDSMTPYSYNTTLSLSDPFS